MRMPNNYRQLSPITTYTTQYNGFRGVDFATDPQLVDSTRSPDSLNLLTDTAGYPEKRPGWRVLWNLGDAINGLHSFMKPDGTKLIVAHVGTKLYAMDSDGGAPSLIYGGMADAKSWSFTFGGRLYLLDGTNYLYYDGTAVASVETTAYVPTVVINSPPEGGGVAFEAVNFLAPKRKISFVGDDGVAEVAQLQISTGATVASGTVNLTITLGGSAFTVPMTSAESSVDKVTAKINSTLEGNTPFNTDWSKLLAGDTFTFTAKAKGVKSDAIFNPGTTGVIGYMITTTQGTAPKTVYNLGIKNITAVNEVSVNGSVITTGFTNNLTAGTVTFSTAPPSGNGVDNVVITFTPPFADATYPNRIKRCRFGAWFGQGNDTRVFVSGNPDYPNWDFMSGLYDPTYFPDTGYTKVGADGSAIMGYLRQYSNQLIVKEDNAQDATIFLRTAEYDDEGKPYFPLKQGVTGVGAIAPSSFATLRDKPLFLAREGVFTLTLNFGGVDQERTAQSCSYFVDPKLTREANLREAAAVAWDGFFLLAVNGHCYVADGRQTTGRSRTEYKGFEWFYWNNMPAKVFLERDGELYFGTADGRVCKLNSDIDNAEKFGDGGHLIPAHTDENGKLVPDHIEGSTAISTYWCTKVDDDGDFMRYKNLPRRGSGLLVKPYSRASVDISVLNDENLKILSTQQDMVVFDFNDLDFAQFSFNTGRNPVVVPLSSPVRRYKTIQIIARNEKPNEGFGIYGILKRFTVGDYVR